MKIFGIEIQIDRYEDKLNLIRKYQKYVYLLIFFIALYYLYILLIQPKTKIMKEQLANISTYEKVLAEKRASLSERGKIEKALEELKQQLIQKEKEFFSENNFEDFTINTLSHMAWSYDIKLNTIQFQREELVEDNIYMIPLIIKFDASFQSLLNFYQDLEKFDRIIKIGDVQISRKSVNPTRLNIGMTIYTYILKKV
jgi:Tfp pilus assembly protein PilO